ncbi:MAG TPA: serine O-acetyltransferase EpsC [Bacillales bacterium]|nr:serine O-acetyltransferase EpsC [Bacillales bacterium]
MLSKLKADIKRFPDHPLKIIITNRGFQSLFMYRLSHLLWKRKIPIIPMILTRVIQILYSIDIDWRAEVDGGVKIIHGMGTVIGQGAKVGSGCTIFHGVTLGIAGRCKNDGFPTIGENTTLGAGSKLLGPIKIGKNAKIGANAVVTKNIPSGATAVGIPAQIIKRQQFEA